MKKFYLFLATACLSFTAVLSITPPLPPTVVIPTNWKSVITIKDVYALYPGQVQSLFSAINLDYPGLETVKSNCAKGDTVAAAQALLTYYGKSSLITPVAKLPSSSSSTTAIAEEIIKDTYTFQEVKGTAPRLQDGHLDWNYKGPQNDLEWAWALNRHYSVSDLITAYKSTGNLNYVSYINTFIKDWIISSWPYPGVANNTAMWRGLEVCSRERVWKSVFYELWNTGKIDAGTALLMLTSLPSHAHYSRNFHGTGNWLIMEMSGLATLVSAWPEFKESKSWLDYSVNTMVASMADQVYPDGVQKELTSHYHGVSLDSYNSFLSTCNTLGIALPDYYKNTIKDMYNYLAQTIRPDGYGLLNNDGDLLYNRDKILAASNTYNRTDWSYMASNGSKGIAPTTQPSVFFPYAGQLISRSDYSDKTQWSFFDMGPGGWGSHYHCDKLHMSVFAYNHDLLVDAGRFAYTGDVAAKYGSYAKNSQSHNVIMVDGKGQNKGVEKVDAPADGSTYSITKDYDYGSGMVNDFAGISGTFSHTRSVMYVRGHFWIVVDRLVTDRPRSIQTLWHWHPSCIVKNSGNVVYSDNTSGNLKIIPVGSPAWTLSLVKGQENPIQGWYSKEYNIYEANTASIYSTTLTGNDTFVWILYPSEGKAPDITTSIISKQVDRVTLNVNDPGVGQWTICLPSLNKENIQYSFTAK